jgi:hypothetical protein
LLNAIKSNPAHWIAVLQKDAADLSELSVFGSEDGRDLIAAKQEVVKVRIRRSQKRQAAVNPNLGARDFRILSKEVEVEGLKKSCEKATKDATQPRKSVESVHNGIAAPQGIGTPIPVKGSFI